MYYFSTYFDHRYLARGLALYRSLERVCSSFRLFVLCMDQKCYEILSDFDLANIELIPLDQLEKDDLGLLQAKQNRSVIEYYFTCTPSLPLYIFEHYPTVDFITYLDADLYFFANPVQIFDEIGNNSIAITAHRFPPHLKHKEMHGKYNVGWLSFRRDKSGLSCLQWYRHKCNEWCYDRVEEDRYADQKYLDSFPRKFEGVVELQHKGANLAPWNIDNYSLTIKEKCIYVDEQQLVFYHFHDFKRLVRGIYDSSFSDYKAQFTKLIRQNIYLPYLEEISKINAQIKDRVVNLKIDSVNQGGVVDSFTLEKPLARISNRYRNILRICKMLLTRTFILWHEN